MTAHHIGGADATTALAVLESLGVTPETAVHEGGATGDYDGPGETTIDSRDPDGLLAENRQERQWRWFA